MMNTPAIHIAPTVSAKTDFEHFYGLTRAIEKRVYTDEQVALLPGIAAGHAHEREWNIRKRSAARLVNYLQQQHRPLNILEVGCGNGWLSNALAQMDNSQVLGIDLNYTEVEQAQRVFKRRNLNFACQGFDIDKLCTNQQFDVIVFAAVLPYFKSARETIRQALSLLKPGGEIHLTDAHFYRPDELPTAIKACTEYFNAMGYPEMSDMYFHHTLDCLAGWNYRVMINPRSIISRCIRKEPFYWIVIKNN